MTDDQIDPVINFTSKAVFLLGFATVLVQQYKDLECYHEETDKCNLFLKQVDDLIYGEIKNEI